MITSVSEFTALIPPTRGLTHVAVTAAWVLVREQGGRLVQEEGREQGRRRGERRGTEAAAARSTRFCLRDRAARPGGKLESVQPLKSPARPGAVRKQHLSQVKLLPYFLQSCYAGKVLFK